MLNTGISNTSSSFHGLEVVGTGEIIAHGLAVTDTQHASAADEVSSLRQEVRRLQSERDTYRRKLYRALVELAAIGFELAALKQETGKS